MLLLAADPSLHSFSSVKDRLVQEGVLGGEPEKGRGFLVEADRAVAMAAEGEIETMHTPQDLTGYVPKTFPQGQPDDQRYDHIFLTEGCDFSVLEPLQAWVDLLQAGISPSNVRVLGINGGPIAAFEYRLALALGARVGVVEHSGRAADALLLDPSWSSHPLLIRLPKELLQNDPATLRAFVRPGFLSLPKENIEELARQTHESYLTANRYSDTDPVRQKYSKLREDLKESNRQQISYAAEILATEGYQVRYTTTSSEAIPLPVFTDEELERMAELEHGRWNMERLASGWRYGQGTKDVAQKTTPCIVPWSQLPDGPDGVKMYDRNAIANYTRLLALAGYEIVRGTRQEEN